MEIPDSNPGSGALIWPLWILSIREPNSWLCHWKCFIQAQNQFQAKPHSELPFSGLLCNLRRSAKISGFHRCLHPNPREGLDSHAGPHPQSGWFRSPGWGLRICRANTFPGAAWGPCLEGPCRVTYLMRVLQDLHELRLSSVTGKPQSLVLVTADMNSFYYGKMGLIVITTYSQMGTRLMGEKGENGDYFINYIDF